MIIPGLEADNFNSEMCTEICEEFDMEVHDKIYDLDDRYHELWGEICNNFNKMCGDADNIEKIKKFAVEFEINKGDICYGNQCIALMNACISGNIEIVQYLVEHFKLTKEVVINSNKLAFGILPMNDDSEDDKIQYTDITDYIKVSEYIAKHFGLTTGEIREDIISAFHIACVNGFSAAKIIAKKYELTLEEVRSNDNLALRCCASIDGNLKIARFLVKQFKLTIEDARAQDNCILCTYCENGQIEFLQWFVEHFGLTIEDVRANNYRAFHAAYENAQRETAQYLIDYFGLTRSEIQCSFKLESKQTGIPILKRKLGLTWDGSPLGPKSAAKVN